MWIVAVAVVVVIIVPVCVPIFSLYFSIKFLAFIRMQSIMSEYIRTYDFCYFWLLFGNISWNENAFHNSHVTSTANMLYLQIPNIVLLWVLYILFELILLSSRFISSLGVGSCNIILYMFTEGVFQQSFLNLPLRFFLLSSIRSLFICWHNHRTLKSKHAEWHHTSWYSVDYFITWEKMIFALIFVFVVFEGAIGLLLRTGD